MENQNTKKVLSECSNTQSKFYLGCGNSINSMKKVDSVFTSSSSDAPTANMCTCTVISESLKSALINNHPNVINDANDFTTPRRKSEENLIEIANNQIRDFSDNTAVDYGITPEFFTNQNKEEFKNILKKLRRRSTIGARGSPENDFLIRYIAKQRRMEVQETLSESSPSQHQKMLLKDKIAAFQSSFKTLEETEEKAVHIHSASNTRLNEQSMQTWSLEDTNNALEKNVNNTFMSRDGISEDAQMHSPRSPSWRPLLSGTNVMSKSAVESTSVSLLATPSTGISKSESGVDKELRRNDPSQHSSKKVRFSEKQNLEIFDESRPPITPVGKGHSLPNPLRSVLKKTPVKIVSEGLKDLQGSSEEMATPIYPESSDLEERKNNSPDHQTPLIRTTRNFAKRKCVVKTEEKNLVTKIEAQNQLRKLQKVKTSTKSKKAPAARPKVVGERRRRRRRRKKEEQKVFHGPCERVSKKPLLSPIPEVTENASFCSSLPNTPIFEVSTSDDSLSDLHAKFIYETAEDKKSLPHAIEMDSHDQHSSPQEEDGITASFVQPQELALNNGKQRLPGDVPEKISPGKLRSSLNGNEQVVGRDCLSSRTEIHREELLNICEPSKNIKAKENSFFTIDFTAEVMNESNEMNFEEIPGNSRRSTEDSLNTDPTETSSTDVPGGDPAGLLPCSWTADDIVLLNHFEENRNVTKKVRRSMRGQKGAECEGLAWVEIAAADFLGQVPLQPGPRRKRRSLCALDAGKDQSVALRIQRDRRASLGYKSDRCSQKNL